MQGQASVDQTWATAKSTAPSLWDYGTPTEPKGFRREGWGGGLAFFPLLVFLFHIWVVKVPGFWFLLSLIQSDLKYVPEFINNIIGNITSHSMSSPQGTWSTRMSINFLYRWKAQLICGWLTSLSDEKHYCKSAKQLDAFGVYEKLWVHFSFSLFVD